MDGENNLNGECSLNDENHLVRGLKSRHMIMISLSGCIGTGLFVAVGFCLNSSGPGGALVSHITLGIMIYFLMSSLGEMATYLPIAGSFQTYTSRFLDEALGFSLGWNYWYGWAICVAAELSAAGIVMKYWFPGTNPIIWSAIVLALIFIINALSARAFGEAEYWVAFMKIAIVVVFIVVGLMMIFGVIGPKPIGFSNLTAGEAPFVGGFSALVGVFMIAGYSFQGSELVGISAAECENPEKTIPKATRAIFFRLLVFFVTSIFIISCIIPYNNPNLLNADINNVAISPFTMIFSQAGIPAAAFIMNVIILVSLVSVGNSGVYACTRMLFSLAEHGQAPKAFAKLTKRGVPMNALYITCAVGFLSFLSSYFGSGQVYLWLVNDTTVCGFIAWGLIAICHMRFRKAYVAQGYDLKDLKYKARFYPIGPIITLAVCSFIVLGLSYDAVTNPDGIDWLTIIANYCGVVVFLALWLGYKFIKKTKVVPLMEVNLSRDDVR